jgi:thiol:disulfide interchange protein DsbD
VVHGDDLTKPRADDGWRVVEAVAAPVKPRSWFQTQWDAYGLLVLGPIFLVGLGLALTPCVLPIVPLTVSVVSGGKATVSRKAYAEVPDAERSKYIPRTRLTWLLTVYVLGLAMAYGLAGFASGLAGKAVDVEAAFRNPVVLWVFAGIFLFLAAGMFGVIEFQPPSWLERARGGAQRKAGSAVGSFLLGVMAAVIASPCTGPVIVGMLAFTTKAGDPWLGFALFFTLGLGLGAMFFAAGSMNLLLKPGPWMVAVRNGFGVILAGVAFYYLASAGLVSKLGLIGLGVGSALLAAWGVARHLVHKEMVAPAKAVGTGTFLGVAVFAVMCVVYFLARPAAPAPGLVLPAALVGALGTALVVWQLLKLRAAPSPLEAEEEEAAPSGPARFAPLAAVVAVLVGTALSVFASPEKKSEGWITLKDVAHLTAELERAKREERPAVVKVSATWCYYCKLYDRTIEEDPYLSSQFREMVRLKIDVEHDARQDLRTALGMPDGQPYLMFIDAEGRIRRAADIDRWLKDQTVEELRRRVDFLFDRTVKTASR